MSTLSRLLTRRCHGLRLAAVLAMLSAQTSEAHPQSVGGVIDGVVTDTSLVPLADALVSIIGLRVQAVTGTNGHFRILELPAGRHVMLVRRLGFEPVSLDLTVERTDTLRMSLALDRVVTVLNTVTVKGALASPRMAEFEERRASGFGHFMTEAEIEQRHSLSMEDIFHLLTGTRARFGGATRACLHEQWYVDGVALPMETKITQLPPPKELAGIEFYSGPATTPLRYKGTGGAGFCGVILMWTKGG